MELNIEYLSIDKLTPYEKNTRKHQDFDVDQIAASIENYGFNDPIGIWGKKNLIVEGHGRVLAAKKLGMDKVPCLRLDHLTDKQRREYAIVHNKTAELSNWDFDILKDEIGDLDFSAFDFNFDNVSRETIEQPEEEEKEETENPYTMNINAPIYEIKGECPELSELCDKSKTESLISEIESAKVPDDIKEFLKCAACRHFKFDYSQIAEYYAHADKNVQQLFENSALVIIDFNASIRNGFTKLSKHIEEMRSDCEDDEEE